VRVYIGPLAAPLLYVSPTQINAIAPLALLPGDWEVAVVFDGRVGTARAAVKAFSPGLFPVMRHPDGTPIDRQRSARPGDWILVYGTGFGATTPALGAGALAPPLPVWLVSPVEARIGDLPLGRDDIYYAGLAPGFAGLYQFNLRVPVQAPAGDLEVVVRVEEEWSQRGLKVPVTR